MKVLIVDDSEVMRDRLTAMISELPEVTVISRARDGQEAVDYVRELKPEVVILDIRLPVKNGLEVLQEMKNEKSPPTVIVLTNSSYPQYRQRCLEAGADFFLDKSKEYEKIVELLRISIKEEA